MAQPRHHKPITYRYNAFWLMRDCRGPQYPVKLSVPEMADAETTHAYGVATCDGKQFNIVLYYGYPYEKLAEGKSIGKLKVRVRAAIPASVRGRTLVIARADCKNMQEGPAQTIAGDKLDVEVEVPSLSGVSLTVR